MNEISLAKRNKVVKLFFRGLSYDDIALQVGVGKGSVVNIIEEFREGDLTVPSDMTEYVDALRKIAVDMRKYDTSISQVMTCARIHVKLMDMGVDVEKTEQWIDTCQEIATPSVSGNELLNAAMELVQLKAEAGLNYEDLITDYKAKRNERDELGNEITQQNATLTKVKSEHNKEKEKATRELESITMAMTTSQELFQKQKDSLKFELDEYLTQNKLSWNKANLVKMMFDTELNEAGLNQREIEDIENLINHAGSLSIVVKNLKHEKDVLKTEVDKLSQRKQIYIENVKELKGSSDQLERSVSENRRNLKLLNNELESKRSELQELEHLTDQRTHNFYVSRLILDFLGAPDSLNNFDFDRLVNLMIALRQKRLGIEPKRVTGVNGEVICEYLIPKIYGNIKVSDSDIDGIRGTFAHLLTPMVKDEFISRFDYDMAELKHKTEVLNAVLQERNRHIL